MKNDFKHSDKRMQEKLGGFQVPAPEGAWAGIEGTMAASGKRKGLFFFWFALLFIGVIGSGIFAFTYFYGENAGNTTNSKNTTSAQASNAHNTTQSDSSGQKNNSDNTHTTANNNTSQNDTQQTEMNASSNEASSNNSNHSASSTNASNRTSNKTNGNTDNNQTGSNTNNASNGSTGNSRNAGNTVNTKKVGNNVTPNSAAQNSNLGQNTINALATQSSNSSNPATSQKTPGDPNGTSASSSTVTPKTRSDNQNSLLTRNVLAARPLFELPISVTGTPFTDPFEIKPPKSPSRWSLEAGLDLSLFKYTASGADSIDYTFLNNSYTKTRGQGGFIRANYQVSTYISMHSGFELSQNRATQEYSTFTTTSTTQIDTVGFFFDSINQQQVAIVDTNIITTQEEQLNSINSATSQISIPIGVMFHLPLGTRSELGINVSGLVGIRTKSVGSILVDANGNTIDANSAYRTVNFSMRTAIRYSHRLNEHSAIYAEPYFGFGLNNQSNAAIPFVSRFRNSGIRVGFRYNF